jgi:hypothetical protein
MLEYLHNWVIHMDPGGAILIGATGTWIIAVIALGDRLRRPRLRIKKDGFSGTKASHGTQSVRYYFVCVKNQCRRFVSAHEVQAVITRIEKSSAAGPEIIFDEDMPLAWQRQEYLEHPILTLGTPGRAGVFFVQQDGTLGITTALTPKGTLPAHFPREHKGQCTLWITLKALSIEADSRPLKLRIDWSGRWHDGKAEIENECKVAIEPTNPIAKRLSAVTRRMSK